MKAKTIALVTLIFMSTLPALSQRRAPYVPFSSETQFSIGPELAVIFPQGFGIGGSFRYEQPLKVIEHLTVLASIGFIAYSTSETYNYGPGSSYKATNKAVFIPVMGGAKYYFPGPSFAGFYGSLEAGVGFGSSSVSYSTYYGPGNYSSPSDARGVMVCPGVGYVMGPFDFNLRYFSVGIVSIRAAYVFKFKR